MVLARAFLELLKVKFNAGVKYKGKTWKWDTVILSKTQELALFLLHNPRQVHFIEPHPSLHRIDTQRRQDQIPELTQRATERCNITRASYFLS